MSRHWNRRGNCQENLEYEQLESRNLLATFAGTANDDVVIVRFTNGIPTEVEINGVVNANPDPTAHLNLISGVDEITFENVEVNGSLSEYSVDGIAGSVNDVLTFDMDFRDGLRLISGAGDDYWHVDYEATFDFRFVGFETNAGDDVIDSLRGYFSADLGSGNDRVMVHSTSHFAFNVDAGDGFDEFEFVETDARFHILGKDEQLSVFPGSDFFPIAVGSQINFELFIAPPPELGYTNLIHYVREFSNSGTDSLVNNVEWIVNGRTSLLRHNDGEGTTGPGVRLRNFNEFSTTRNIDNGFFTRDFARILRTEFPIEVTAANIDIGQAGNWQAGNTDGINHEIRAFAQNYIRVSNATNQQGQQAWLRSDPADSGYHRLSGLTPAPVLLRQNFNPYENFPPADWILHGSLLGDDNFAVSDNLSRLLIFTHGGDDKVTLGSVDKNLEQLGISDTRRDSSQYSVNVIGGAGTDRLFIRDNNFENVNVSDQAEGFNIDGPWVFTNNTDRAFFGAWHTGIEVVHVHANDQANRFRVRANTDVNYILHGNDPEFGYGDSVFLEDFADEQPYLIAGENGLHTWWFGNEEGDFKPIRFYNFESIQGNEFVVAGSQPGTRATVTYSQPDGTDVFTIKPFNDSFRGGVNVASADLNGDAIPEIVVTTGAGAGLVSQVRIYDGSDQRLLSSFVAFELGYAGGVDVAIGDVTGDSGFEIIVSKLTGSNDVRVFTSSGRLNRTFYTPTSQFSAFDDAPPVGSFVTTADLDGDNIDEVILSANTGWQPLVTVRDVRNATLDGVDAIYKNSFLVHQPAFSRGIKVQAANVFGDRSVDLVVTTAASIGQSPANLWFFDGSKLPGNQPNQIAQRSFRVAIDDEWNEMSFVFRDFDRDGFAERLYAASGNSESTVKAFNIATGYSSAVFEFDLIDSAFEAGHSIG